MFRKTVEAIILEGNKESFISNNLPFSSGFSQVILEITELVVTLMELYLKARLVIRLGFSLLPRLLKITGQLECLFPVLRTAILVYFPFPDIFL